jgi:hypothetical protein
MRRERRRTNTPSVFATLCKEFNMGHSLEVKPKLLV